MVANGRRMSEAPHAARADDSAMALLRSVTRTLTRADRAALALYVVLSLLGALAGGAVVVCLMPLVQPGPVHAIDLRTGSNVARQAAVFALVAAGFAAVRWWAARLGARLVSAYGLRLRREVHARLVEASLPSLATASSAEIANVLTYNIEIIVQGFSALQQLLVAALTGAVSLGLAFWVSPPLMLATPLIVAAGLLASRLFGREQSQVSRRYVADMTELFWHSEDFPRRLRHVRSFGREGEEKRSYGGIAARLSQGYRRQLELVASGRLVLEVLAASGIVAVFLLAQWWHGVEQASLLAVCLLLGRLLPYLASTRQSFQQLRSAAPALALWRRHAQLYPAMAAAPAMPADACELRIDRLRVTPPARGVVVEGLRLVRGELTLVQGDSGIGKSSLLDALAGMLAPREFTARADGRFIGYEDYRQQVKHGAYVSQSVRPWQRTVRECLRWAAPDASEAALRQVLADVGLDRCLAESPQGLDTELHGAASRLSGGELQRLLLAQVILRQPRIALLDEATGALDAASEIEVLAALKRRLPGCVLVVVSHRPGLAALAEQTLVIDAAANVRIAAQRPSPLRPPRAPRGATALDG